MKNIVFTVIIASLLGVLSPVASAAADYVWWEAENAVRSNLTPEMSFKPASAQEASLLSGGGWVGRDPKIPAAECFAEYAVTAPQDGTYGFYARKFWKHGPFRWRFDAQPWQQVTGDVALLDSSSLKSACVNWIHAGKVTLTAGEHTLRIELLAEAKAACFDAFCLSLRPFQAHGALKPDAKSGLATDGWFPFEPDWDSMTASPIDLRYLNEAQAGDGGFIQVRGEEFIHGKTGKPVRFWSVCTQRDVALMDRADIDSAARFLAKHGVNLLRIQMKLYHGRGPNALEVDPAELDRIFYLIAAMKREGIYSTLAIHWQSFLDLSEMKEFPGYSKGKSAFGLDFFSPDFQAAIKKYWKAVLTTQNPYTGKTLAQDPAVAFCEIVNEDSLFFWTFSPYNAIPAEQIGILEKRFGEGLGKKYGGLEKAFAAWNQKPGAVKGDDVAAGRAGLYFIGTLTGNDWAVKGRNQKRAEDTARFLVGMESDYYAQMCNYLHNDLGYPGPICGSNDMTADDAILTPLYRWANTQADFMDLHSYYRGERKKNGPQHFAMTVGDSYCDRSLLRFDPVAPGGPVELGGVEFISPIYNGKPTTCTELGWILPNQYHGEMVVMGAVLGRVTGLDAPVFFTLDVAPQWSSGMNGYYPVQTPAVIGQFPAMALIYRLGLIAEGGEVVRARLGTDRLVALKGSPVVEHKNAFNLTAPKNTKTKPVATEDRIDPRVFCVGRVKVDFVPGDKHDIQTMDMKPYIDDEAKTLRGTAGDWTWDYGNGCLALRAAAAQGACGFLGKARALDFQDITLTSSMPFGTIVVVAMDGKPLATSDRMLLQVMSQVQDYGFEAKPETGLRTIDSLGSGPLNLRNMAGTVTFKRADASRLTVTRLDPNGYPKQTATGAATIELAKDALYYMIETRK